MAIPCGEHPEPSSAACPDVCTGGCNNGKCVISCSDDNACPSAIECPAGMNCQVTCTGLDSCSDAVHCDDDFPCHVTCNGEAACKNFTIYCGARSDCQMTCGATAPQSNCLGAHMVCGAGECHAQCFGQNHPSMDCGDACACNGCS